MANKFYIINLSTIDIKDVSIKKKNKFIDDDNIE